MSFAHILARKDQQLEVHLKQVQEMGKSIYLDISLELDELLQKIIEFSIDIVTLTHDIGKATSFFQCYIHNKGEGIDNEKISRLKNHSLFSSILTFSCFLILKEYIDEDIAKRKLDQIKFIQIFLIFGFLSQLIVRSHHTSSLKDMITIFNDYTTDENIAEHKKRFEEMKKEFVEMIITDYILPKISKIKYKEKFLFKIDSKEYKTISEKIISSFKSLIYEEKFKHRVYVTLFNPDKFSFEICQKIFFLGKMIYSILLISDKMNASLGIDLPKTDFLSCTEFNKILERYLIEKRFFFQNEKFPLNFKNLNQRRRYILQLLKKQEVEFLEGGKIFELSVPTGYGKTLSSLFFASKLKSPRSSDEKLKYFIHPKIIYSLPFLSIIEQTKNVLEDFISEKEKKITSDLLLVHHHLTELDYKTLKDDENYEASVSQLLIEGWNSQYILTTFNQLFNAIFKSTKNSSFKFFQLLNNTWIMDEVQAIPLKYWKMFESNFITLKTIFKINMILMSATLPLIFTSDEHNNKREKPHILIGKRDLDRLTRNINRINLIFHGEITLNNFFKKTIDIINKEERKNVLIVLNTRRSAQDMYLAFEDYFSRNKNIILVFLAATLTPKTKRIIIEEVKSNLDQSKETSKKVIMISTQCIEAGVDVDFDIILRDFAPLDNIIQTAGRCNRNERNHIGRVEIYRIKEADDENKFYANYIYDPHLLNLTRKLIYKGDLNPTEPIIFPEDELCTLVNNHYQNINNFFREGSMEEEITFYNENVRKFNYEKLSKNFELIEQYSPYTFLVEEDEEATEILEEMKELYKVSYRNFDKNIFNKILRIKKRIQKFLVVAYLNKEEKKRIDELEKIKGFYIISKEKLDCFYSKKLGLLFNLI